MDLAKRVYQIHAVNQFEAVALTKAMTPGKFFDWCRSLPAGCMVAMESCSGAHYVGRRLAAMGLSPRIIAAHHVKPYRVAGAKAKNDANDAAAICEAASRPHLHSVPIKTAQQQGIVALHRFREGYKEERTALINRIRGLLAEFGLSFAQSPEALRKVLPGVLEDGSNELPGVARLALEEARQHWEKLEERMLWCEQRIEEHVRQDEQAKKASQLMGVGVRRPRRWWPAWPISANSKAPSSSVAGWGWCPAKTPLGARTSWGESPSVGTLTCARC